MIVPEHIADVASDDPAPVLPTASPVAEPRSGDLVRRHRLATRIWHWINAGTLAIMLMSGLMIFNAHPRLYWGQYGANPDPAWLEIGAHGTSGFLRVGKIILPTTGVLGVSADREGQPRGRAFPRWATIPSDYSLADARIWHLAFAWILALGLTGFMIVSLVNRHFQRDMTISGDELRPAHLLQDVKDHARLRFPTGAASLRYNILQKLSYAAVIFVLLPLVILTGLTLSPGMDSGWSWLLSLFGGRASARSLHFLAMSGLVAFFLVHIMMVILAGPINEIRSMITGRYRIPPDKDDRS